ncbi:MAG: zinc finger domain-containing protein, partial [Actinomycetota bacterium]
EDVEAVGKHLLYHWSSGEILHVHLGLFGKFHAFRGPTEPTPTDGTRLALANDDVTIFLAGPTACDLVTPEEADAIRAKLGPDPLAPGQKKKAIARFSEAVGRRKVPLGAVLLDQSVIAGIGNVFRAEVPYLAGIDPNRSARDTSDDERRELWDLATRELKRGLGSGRIATVDPAEVGATRRSQLDDDTRVYVYRRGGMPCHRCGTEIRQTEIANRKTWWCPTCQPS